MIVKFFDVKKANENFFEDYKKKFNNFLNSDNIILGEQTQTFERNFAKYCDVKYCLTTACGLDALFLIFLAYKENGKLKTGDQVLIPANAYSASFIAIYNAGLIPVPVEIDMWSMNFDFKILEETITPETKAILAVHNYGTITDFEKINAFARKYDLLVIEDAAQAHGSSFGDKKAGNLGNAAAFSFYPTKNLGTLGEGGAITTNDQKLYDKIFYLRNYGRGNTHNALYKGINSRINELQAGFLNIKLNFLDKENENRRKIAHFYKKNIKSKKIILPQISAFSKRTNWHIFYVLTEEREKFREYLNEKGIQTAIHYPIPVHKQKAFKDLKGFNFPITEKILSKIVSLPIYGAMPAEQVEYVVKIINGF